MGLSTEKVEQLPGFQFSHRFADSEGDSTFEARDRDFPASLVVRDVFSGEITRRMISSDSVFTKTVFLACADSDPCGRISIMSPGFACGMATMIISLEWFSLKHPVESVF